MTRSVSDSGWRHTALLHGVKSGRGGATIVRVVVDGIVHVRPDLTAVELAESCRIGGSHRIANEDLGVGAVVGKPTGTIVVPRRALNVEYDQRSTALCLEAAAAVEVRHAIGDTGKDRPGSGSVRHETVAGIAVDLHAVQGDLGAAAGRIEEDTGAVVLDDRVVDEQLIPTRAARRHADTLGAAGREAEDAHIIEMHLGAARVVDANGASGRASTVDCEVAQDDLDCVRCRGGGVIDVHLVNARHQYRYERSATVDGDRLRNPYRPEACR